MKKFVLILILLFVSNLYAATDEQIRSAYKLVRDTIKEFNFSPEREREAWKTFVMMYSDKTVDTNNDYKTIAMNIYFNFKMPMVFVKGGCYEMGDTFGDGNNDEKPVHTVCVDDFYMGKYEVTQWRWKKVMKNNPSYFKSCGYDCPVEQVSWSDVQQFIGKLNNQTGNHFRLPTEAEWEYTARSGGKNEKYSGGNDVDAVAWYDDNSGDKTHPVGQKQANGLGIYDMSGNVWEWCSDWYDKNYYSSSPRNNPQGPSSGSDRVGRGGSWYSNARNTRAANRSWDRPSYRGSLLGFRLVLSAD